MEFLKSLVNPLPILFLTVGWFLFTHRARRLSWVVMAGVVIVVYLLSTGPVASTLTRALETGCPTRIPSVPVDSVVVLGGGLSRAWADGTSQLSLESSARLLAGLRVYREAHAGLLVLSGGATVRGEEPEAAAMARQAVALGVPDSKITQEDRSLDTWQEATELESRHLLEGRVALVTASTHMRRASFAFKRLAVVTEPVAVACRQPVTISLSSLVPNSSALASSGIVTYELVGLWWYTARQAWTSRRVAAITVSRWPGGGVI
jgi:uncharacterized SAM-binding protein YcdF (DUF218 family)